MVTRALTGESSLAYVRCWIALFVPVHVSACHGVAHLVDDPSCCQGVGMEIVTLHLPMLNHTSIITGPWDVHHTDRVLMEQGARPRYKKRLDGCLAALARYGLSFCPFVFSRVALYRSKGNSSC